MELEYNMWKESDDYSSSRGKELKKKENTMNKNENCVHSNKVHLSLWNGIYWLVSSQPLRLWGHEGKTSNKLFFCSFHSWLSFAKLTGYRFLVKSFSS